MTRARRRRATVYAAAVSILVAGLVATPGIAATSLRLHAETPLTAYGNHVAWSGPARGDRWRLFTLVGTQAVALPIASEPVTFDADLGPGRDGRPALVFSRCRTYPAGSGASNYGPWYRRQSADDCDVYLYDFEHRRARAIPGAATRDRSEYLPSIWRNRLVFAAMPTHPRKRDVPWLYTVRLDAKHPVARRLGRGSVGEVSSECAPYCNSGVTGIDLRGTRFSFTWGTLHYGDDGIAAGTSELWTARLGDTPRRVAMVRTHGAFSSLQATANGDLEWLEEGGSAIVLDRYAFSTHALTRVPLDGLVLATAVGDRRYSVIQTTVGDEYRLDLRAD